MYVVDVHHVMHDLRACQMQIKATYLLTQIYTLTYLL